MFYSASVYNAAVTWSFLYLAIFLVGFTLALVSGLVRRLLHPSALCDGIVVPSHEHWAGLHTPKLDLFVSFLTVFGLVTLALQGFTHMEPEREILIGALVGCVGACVLRLWLCRTCDPSRGLQCQGADARVVRAIPPNGFGQVAVDVGGCQVKLAARTTINVPIAEGVLVRILDRQESVVIVEPTG